MMRSNTQILENAGLLYEGFVGKIEELKQVNVDIVKDIQTSDVETAIDKASLLVNCISSEVRCLEAGGTQFVDFITRTSTTCEDKLTEMELTISSKLRAERKFKKKYTIEVNDDLVDNLGVAFKDALFDAYYVEQAHENIVAVNEKLKEIYDVYEGIVKKVFFTVDFEDVRVAFIDNDVLVLRADVERALDLSNLGILDEGDEYAELVRDEAIKNFVDNMQTVSITPEILKKRIDVIDSLVDLKTKKHANKLIREGYHKKAVYLKDNKSGVGYFNEKVDGVNIFALLEKDENGEYKYVLNPFNTDTLIESDVDVISLVKEGK